MSFPTQTALHAPQTLVFDSRLYIVSGVRTMITPFTPEHLVPVEMQLSSSGKK